MVLVSGVGAGKAEIVLGGSQEIERSFMFSYGYYAVNCSHWRNPRHNNIVINACRSSCILIEGECEEENDANVFEQ